ncbi:MAG: hypothetical protein JWQ01_1937 [Massilia sp.]|nr:hypothetical protein [Massilia sp.]
MIVNTNAPHPARRFLLIVAILIGWLLLAPKSALAQACSAPNYIAWPAANPVWKLCWTAPNNSSGVDGSGLELSDVYYKNVKIFYKANIPILNVKYDPGGCGGASLSYRDWMWEYQPFQTNNIIAPGYAEPTTPPTTVCNHPGTDAGSFSGVAVQKLLDRLVITTQLRAGWYRYIHQWTFFADGSIEPRIFFTAVANACTNLAHHHNGYWRFDVDLGDPANDVIEESNGGVWAALNESSRKKDTTQPKWRVRDKATNNMVEFSTGIGTGDDAANTFAVADAWALAFQDAETDDGGATTGVDADKEHIDRFINGENIINGNDIVLWYRSGTYHNGDGAMCDQTGPNLKVRLAGAPPPPPTIPVAPSSLRATPVASGSSTLTWLDNSNNENGFKIERSISGGAYVQIASVAANVTSYKATGLTASRSTIYRFRVRAFNTAGDSAYSNIASP